jgi:hypothetical protein
MLVSYKFNLKERYMWEKSKQRSSATYWKISGIEDMMLGEGVGMMMVIVVIMVVITLA